MFADACGEDDGVDGAEDREEGPDVLADAVGVDVERRPGRFVAPLAEREHLAEVVVTGEPLQADSRLRAPSMASIDQPSSRWRCAGTQGRGRRSEFP